LELHVAASVLPWSTDSTPPQALALSPFLRLGFLRAPVALAEPSTLLAVELLCLDETRTRVLSAARHVWQSLAATDRESVVDAWARETQRSLFPESPLAIIRERAVLRTRATAPDEAVVVTAFAFRTLRQQRGRSSWRRPFRLRSSTTDMRFRDGRFGGPHIPAALQAFEVAPPLVRAVEPVHLPTRPGSATAWNFGWSGLRLSVELAVRGVSGSLAPNAALWWQAVSCTMQYRSARTKLPTAGFPKGFRARAVEVLLPVLPNPALPEADAAASGWQPVLPARSRFTRLGSRPGVFHIHRIGVQRQALPSGAVVASGGVPIQQRYPRPVALPSNADHPERELRTWASAFAATTPGIFSLAPTDEAYFAGAPGLRDAARLALRLVVPKLGLVTAAFDGRLVFEVEDSVQGLSTWQVHVRLATGGQTFTFRNKTAITTGTVAFDLATQPGRDTLADLRVLLAAHAGRGVSLDIRVARGAQQNAYFQSLTFRLRFQPPAHSPAAPLQPVFVQFEDPEYNRRLASSTKQTRLNVRLAADSIESATLASDREQYNPGSIIVVRYDGTPAIDALQPLLSFARIEPGGAMKPLLLPYEGVGADPAQPLASGSVLTFSLDQLRETVASQEVVARLAIGEALQISLRLQASDDTTVLQLPIVAEPQVPSTQSAYALLRRNLGATAVECVRFAWSPSAQRIELIDAEDLRLGVTRRRAVFKLSDTTRTRSFENYSLQKITASGSTHRCDFVVPE
jgi:hypothetical protein